MRQLAKNYRKSSGFRQDLNKGDFGAHAQSSWKSQPTQTPVDIEVLIPLLVNTGPMLVFVFDRAPLLVLKIDPSLHAVSMT